MTFKTAFVGGGLAFLIIISGTMLFGGIGGFEAKSLLESMLPTARFFYSSVITASATILALMLTLLSLSFNTQSELNEVHYERIKQIALILTITFVTATTLLLFLIVPLRESDQVPSMLYRVYYYAVLAGSAIQGGLLVTIVLMLYSTVRDMILIFGLGKEEHPLIEGSDRES